MNKKFFDSTGFSKAVAFSNKRGEVGETATWFVATIVIALILAVFIGLSYLSKPSSMSNSDNGIDPKNSDLFLTKSFSGYLFTNDDNGKRIYENFQAEGNLKESNGKFAQNLLNMLYSNADFCLFVRDNQLNKNIGNDYFCSGELRRYQKVSALSERIYLVRTTNLDYSLSASSNKLIVLNGINDNLLKN